MAGDSQIVALGPWFYDFALPGGVQTNAGLDAHLRSMHADRAAMLETAVRVAFPRGLSGVHAIDVGCHEGFFSHALLGLGASDVLGIDLREGNIRKAELVAEAMGVSGVRWRIGDAEDLDRSVGDERFGLSLAFGLLYHCENPVRVLRQIAGVTDQAMIIETQLADEPAGASVEWGREGYRLGVRGGFAVVDESRLHPTNNETGSRPLALCPSENALRTVLAHCGFPHFVRIVAPEGANEQLRRGKRGVFLATRERDLR